LKPAALIPEGVHKSERHMVARGEHGREIPSSQELAAREVAELRAPVTQDRGLQTVASRVHFREQYRALVGHALVWARVLLLLRALSVLGDTV
jgi:hypothetical protein